MGTGSILFPIYLQTIPKEVQTHFAGLELTDEILAEAEKDLSQYPELEKSKGTLVADRVTAATMSALSRRVDKWHMPQDEAMFTLLKTHVTDELRERGKALSRHKEALP